MTLDIKNNNYLLSFLAGLIGTIIYFIINKVSEKDDKNGKIDYLLYAKLLILITAIVLCVLMYTRSDNKNVVASSIDSNLIGTSTPTANTSSVNTGLQEVNMNQAIHTGNPQF